MDALAKVMKRAKHGSGRMARKFVKALGLGAMLAAGLALAPAAFAKDWKTVVIGMEGAYEPWNLTDSSGKFVVIMDGMSITDERKKEIDFSKPYAASPGSFLAPKESPLAKATGAGTLINLDKDAAGGDAAIKSVQAALKGKTLGVQVSTTHANFASQYLKDIATVKEYKTTDDRDLDLKSGRIDASLDDLPTNMATASKPDASELAVVGPKLIGGVFGTGEGMGIRKSDADLTAKFDTALTAAIADGTVKKLSEQWFKIDMTPP